MNETLLIKKLIFLLFALSLDGMQDYSQIKAKFALYKEKKLLDLPKNSPLKMELLKLAMYLVSVLESQTPQHLSLAYIIDKLYEIDKVSKKPGFSAPGGGLKYGLLTHSPDQPKSQVSGGGARRKSNLNGKRNRQGVRSGPSSNLTSEEEDFNSALDDDDGKDDFAVVPASNMDNDTVHIKILDDDPRHMRESHNQLHDDEDQLNHQSDMMRSIKMLVGGSGMTVKSNKNLVLDD